MSSRVEWAPPPSQGVTTRPNLKTTIKLRPPPPPPPRLRTVGAITRAVASYREKREAEENALEPSKKIKASVKTGKLYVCLLYRGRKKISHFKIIVRSRNVITYWEISRVALLLKPF